MYVYDLYDLPMVEGHLPKAQTTIGGFLPPNLNIFGKVVPYTWCGLVNYATSIVDPLYRYSNPEHFR